MPKVTMKIEIPLCVSHQLYEHFEDMGLLILKNKKFITVITVTWISTVSRSL